MAVSLGIFTYYNKNKKAESKNIGDQVQTLAQINMYRKIVSDFYEKDIEFLEFLDNVFENSYPDFDFVFLARDNLSDAKKYNKDIYVIMNGWFMHSEGEGRFDWPPPDNIIPIFLSFHVAKDSLFDKKYIEYYKRHEPIGCRDLYTKNAFEKIGVKAFFTGCLTLTGDYLEWKEGCTNGRSCIIDMKDPDKLNVGAYDFFTHKYAPFSSYKDSLIYAHSLLKGYSEYDEVVSSRLHAYLPCLAMGVPVKFVAPSGDETRGSWGSKGRFGGLKNIGENSDKARNKLNIIQKRLIALSKRKINKALFSSPNNEVIEAVANRYDLVFCCDKSYLPMFLTVLNSIYQNNLENLFNIHLIHNDIDEQTIYKVRGFLSDKLKNMNLYDYRKSFDHSYNAMGKNMYEHNEDSWISEATMLRLFIPELLKDQKKVLYLDCDLIVSMNLKNIFETEVAPNGLALKSSYVDNFLPEKEGVKIRRSGNAGVILMDLDILRKNDFTKYCINLNNKQPFNDQILINIYAEGKYAELEDRFNVFTTQDGWLVDHHNDYILHFVSRRKPWDKKDYLKKRFESGRYYGGLDVSTKRLFSDWKKYDLTKQWKKYCSDTLFGQKL